MRHEYKILGSFVFIILVGIFVLSFPRSGFSQLGCCLNPQGKCPPGQQTNKNGCNFPNPAGGAFIEGEICNESGTGCVEIPPTVTGCCQFTNSCENDVEQSTCTGGGGELVVDGNCVSDSCTPPPPPSGCCQLSGPECNMDDSTTCINEGGTFVDEGTCQVGENAGLCDPQPPPPPTGCCELGNSMCQYTTQGDCQLANGDYQGDDSICPGPPTCGEIPPPASGCCTLGNGVCQTTTATICDGLHGNYLGNNVDCPGPPTCEKPAALQIPTLSQWGLIGVAGLLGLFSLLILIRRQRLT